MPYVNWIHIWFYIRQCSPRTILPLIIIIKLNIYCCIVDKILQNWLRIASALCQAMHKWIPGPRRTSQFAHIHCAEWDKAFFVSSHTKSCDQTTNICMWHQPRRWTRRRCGLAERFNQTARARQPLCFGILRWLWIRIYRDRHQVCRQCVCAYYKCVWVCVCAEDGNICKTACKTRPFIGDTQNARFLVRLDYTSFSLCPAIGYISLSQSQPEPFYLTAHANPTRTLCTLSYPLPPHSHYIYIYACARGHTRQT